MTVDNQEHYYINILSNFIISDLITIKELIDNSYESMELWRLKYMAEDMKITRIEERQKSELYSLMFHDDHEHALECYLKRVYGWDGLEEHPDLVTFLRNNINRQIEIKEQATIYQ